MVIKMKKQEIFFEKVAEILECNPEEISLETNFREDIEDWDSLKGFSLLILFDEVYNKKISVNEFLKCNTIKDLYNSVCK